MRTIDAIGEISRGFGQGEDDVTHLVSPMVLNAFFSLQASAYQRAILPRPLARTAHAECLPIRRSAGATCRESPGISANAPELIAPSRRRQPPRAALRRPFHFA